MIDDKKGSLHHRRSALDDMEKISLEAARIRKLPIQQRVDRMNELMLGFLLKHGSPKIQQKLVNQRLVKKQ